MWKKFSKMVGSRLLVELGSKVVLFILLLWSKVVRSRLVAEVVEFCLMLGSKVVLLSLLLNKDKTEVVLLFRIVVVEEMATRGGQARLSRAEGGETEIDGQGLLFQV